MKLLLLAVLVIIGAIYGQQDEDKKQIHCDCLKSTYTNLFAVKIIEQQVKACQEKYSSAADCIKKAFEPADKQIKENQMMFDSAKDCKDWEELTPNIQKARKLIAEFGENMEKKDSNVYNECIQPITSNSENHLRVALNNCTQYE